MTNEVKANIEQLIQAKEQNRLVVFVGAGVSRNSGIPMWGELINTIKKQYLSISDSETDFLKIAQLFYNKRGKKEYYDTIKKELRYKQASYNPIHEAILSLNPEHIITTNYDDLFEQIIRKERAEYDIITQDSDFPDTTLSTYLIKMHGCFDKKNIVFTEDDYLQYSQNFPLIESFIKGLFASKLVLFIGFSFSDINLKYILQRVESVLGKERQPSYIYLDNPFNELEKDYLSKKGIVPIYFDDISQYLNDNNFKEHETLQPKGNNLFRFIKLIEKPTFQENEFQALSIVNQLYKSLEPFKDFGFIMPSIYEKLSPFNRINPTLDNHRSRYYDKTRPNHIGTENNELIEFFKTLLHNKEPENKYISHLDLLKSNAGSENINAIIKNHTNQLIDNEAEYEKFINVVRCINLSHVHYINEDMIYLDEAPKICDCLACRYDRLEFDTTINIINKIEFNNNDISVSKDEVSNRLLKGTIAIKMGFTKVGLEELQKVVDLSKNQNREILFFLAKYNLKYLWKFASFAEGQSTPYLKAISKNINLKDILNGLKVTKEVRDELDNIINDKYIYEYLDLARKMNEKIIKNYTLFINGGSTTGNNEDNIYTLMNNLNVINNFYRRNQIIDIEFSQFSDFIEVCFESIVYNFITPSQKEQNIFGSYRKVKEFNLRVLRPVIHYHDSQKLRQVLSKLEDNKIILANSDTEEFIVIVCNFFNSFYKDTIWGKILPNKNILVHTEDFSDAIHIKCKTIFKNLILLLGHIKLEESDFKRTVEPLINFLSVQNFVNFDGDDYWEAYLQNNLLFFTLEQKKKLLNQFLHKSSHLQLSSNWLLYFSKSIQQEGLVLFTDVDVFNSLQLENIYHDILCNLFPISNSEIQSKITSTIKEELTKNFNSFLFYDALYSKVITPILFLERIIQDTNQYFDITFDNKNYDLLNFLNFVGYSDLDTNDQKFNDFLRNRYINWLFRFDEFDYDEFQNEWFEYIPTKTFLPKMKNNIKVKNLLAAYLKVNQQSENFKYLSQIYFNHFSE